MFKVQPLHLNEVQIRTFTRLLQHIVSFEPFRAGHALVFQITVQLYSPFALETEIAD